jgi:hypothetical protein
MKLTGAAILVSRGMTVLQAAPAAYPYRYSAAATRPMDVETDNGEILKRWHAERFVLDVEITVGHVSMCFTGRVTFLSTIELVIAHPEGELSISLFCAGTKRIGPKEGSAAEYWKKYRQVLQVTTDGGAVCTISERRAEAAQ